ncbi:MAG: 7TM-DISM domain-containing protein, partial [Bacteroidales bacterium]
MKNRGIATVLFIILVAANLTGQEVVKRGILDLRENGFRKEPVVKLNGEWEFYWHEHLRPVDFIKADTGSRFIYTKVPSYWTDLTDSIEGITPDGYATYRMRILLPEYFRTDLVFQVPVFDSSYRLYLDGKLVASNGVPGQKPTETKPGYDPLVVHYTPNNDTLELVVNVSNYHHRRGGFWLPLTVGPSESMMLKIKREEIFTAGSLGVLFAFTLFFFIFFIIFLRDKTMLYFSLATFGLMVRTMFTGSFPALAFVNIPWIWIIRMEYTGTYIAMIFSLLYFYGIYRDNFIRYINTVLISLFGILILFVLTTPVSLFSWSVLLLIPVVSVNMAYYTVRSFITLFRKRNYEGLMALGFVALLLGTLNDIFSSTSSVFLTHKYILPHTTLFFILMQAIILIFRWVHSYNEENRLFREVDFVNRNLENIVIERTTELTNQKGELEKQNEMIDQKNREL